MNIRHLALLLFAAMAVVLAQSSPVAAQYYTGSATINGPTVSPYLNLLNNNQNNIGLPAYQTIVRPLVDQRQAINRQGAEIQQLERQNRRLSDSRDGGSTRLRSTGHATRFMNYSHYYPGSSGRNR